MNVEVRAGLPNHHGDTVTWALPLYSNPTLCLGKKRKNMVWRTFLSNVLSLKPKCAWLSFTLFTRRPSYLYLCVFGTVWWTCDLIDVFIMSCLNCFQCRLFKAPLSVKFCVMLVDTHLWPAFSYFWINCRPVCGFSWSYSFNRHGYSFSQWDGHRFTLLKCTLPLKIGYLS